MFVDLDAIIKQITPNDIVDISGRQGIWQKQKTTVKADLNMSLSVVPALGMTGKIIGKYAAKQLLNAMPIYLAPVDVMMQKSYQHRVKIWSVNKKYLLHADKAVGGTTIQIKSVSWYQKLGREVKRPIWRLAVIIKSFVFD